MGEFDGARIAGVYVSKQARQLEGETSFSVALECIKGALADANMTMDEVDGFGASFTGGSGGAMATDANWSYLFNREWRWSGAGAGLPSILEAARLITNGRLNAAVLVLSGVRPTNTVVAPWLESHSEWSGWTGSLPDQPVQFGLVAQRYIHENGQRAWDAMAELAASTRNYGHINPDAVYFGRGPFTAQDVKESRFIAEPLTLLMCSTVNDGGCAIVLTRKDRADSKKAVSVVTGAGLTTWPAYSVAPQLDGYMELSQPFRDTLARADVKNEDIDVIEFYDHFASHVLLQYETFGFAKRGEAPDLVKSGAMKLNGKYPTCTDGGLLSGSHNGAPILLRVSEALRQLRGEVKDMCPDGNHTYDPSMCRKVKDAKLAFVSAPGTPTIQSSFLVLGKN